MTEALFLKSYKSYKVGDIVSLKTGYIVNYLAPLGIATIVNNRIIKRFDENKAKLEAFDNTCIFEAEKIKEKYQGIEIYLYKRSFADGRLCGSISTKDICEKLLSTMDANSSQSKSIDFYISPAHIRLPKPIKNEGSYLIKMILYGKIVMEFTLNVLSDLKNDIK